MPTSSLTALGSGDSSQGQRLVELRRVHIVGGAGSGKTTLARQVGVALGAPVYDLDAIGYEEGAGPARPLESRLAEVRRIAAQPAWITEGAFLWWTDDLFRCADLIVWLDLPFRVVAWRIVVRHLKAELAGNNRHPGWRKLLAFLQSVRRYRYADQPFTPEAPDDDAAISSRATEEVLRPYTAKLVRCRRPAEVANLLLRVSG